MTLATKLLLVDSKNVHHEGHCVDCLFRQFGVICMPLTLKQTNPILTQGQSRTVLPQNKAKMLEEVLLMGHFGP